MHTFYRRWRPRYRRHDRHERRRVKNHFRAFGVSRLLIMRGGRLEVLWWRRKEIKKRIKDFGRHYSGCESWRFVILIGEQIIFLLSFYRKTRISYQKIGEMTKIISAEAPVPYLGRVRSIGSCCCQFPCDCPSHEPVPLVHCGGCLLTPHGHRFMTPL